MNIRKAENIPEQVLDFTVDGKCSSCGECCSTILPASDEEIKEIKQYVQKNHIKPKSNITAPMMNTIDLTCPFLDVSKEHKCMIYEVRPLICRKFICSNNKPAWTVDERKEQRKVKSMREIFR